MLVAECSGSKVLAKLRPLGWGRMYVEKAPDPYEGEPWGLDNGAWLAKTKGVPWQPDLFERRLERALKIAEATRNFPLLAVVPDIWGKGRESFELSLSWRHRLPAAFPWFLPIQDGMTIEEVAPVAGEFAGLFLGGSDKYRNRTAWRWVEFAHSIGLLCHVGRCGTPARWRHAFKIGADSCDSSTPLRENRRFKKFAGIWLHLHERGPEAALPFEVAR